MDNYIEVRSPKVLGGKLPAERIPLGSLYKPCIARLPDGQLRLIAESTGPNPNLHLDNDHPIFSSRDGGRTWTRFAVPDLTAGEPYFTALKSGAMLMTGDVMIKNSDRKTLYYIHRSEDGRLLLTHTVRAGMDQLGVRAVLGEELPDSFRFDLSNDIIMVETKTPMNQVSGGGFGPTVQMDDGTLVTDYSYRTGKTNSDLYAEVVRWKPS